MRLNGRTLVMMAVVTGTAALAQAGPIWGWRGDGTGSYPAATPPTKWGPEENVVWKTPMPSSSNASPIIVGDKIFVCADRAPKEEKKDTLLCVSKTDGKILWQRTNDLKDLVSEEAWQQLEKRRAEREALVKEQSQARGAVKKAWAELGLSTKKGREQHVAGLKKQWERRKAAAEKEGKTIDPFKEPDFGPLPSAEQIAAWQAELKENKARDGELDARIRTYQDVAPTRVDGTTGYSTPTPVTDGQHVYVLFASGVVAAYDLGGSLKWSANVGPSFDGYGQASSPALIGDVLLVPVNGTVAFDKKTGRELWKSGANHAYGTPFHVEIGGEAMAVTAGGDVIKVSNGSITVRELGKFAYASPLVSDGVAYHIQGGAMAWALPKTPDGKAEQLWKTGLKNDRYYASAALLDGVLYGITQAAVTSAVDAKDGTKLWEQTLEIGATAYPSVTTAGDYVFISSDKGKTAVLRKGRTFDLVRINTLEPFRSCPVFEGNRMYVRGLEHLYCIGK